MPESKEASADRMMFPAPDFDVRDFARTASGSHRDTLNLDSYSARPLSSETIRSLRYMQVIERATMSHLRSVLVTATHKDARVTAFLTTWAFEKYWIADAIEQIVGVHVMDEADREPFRIPVERTIRESIVANVIGVPMIAVHMALGTVDGWLHEAAYSRIAELGGNAQLSETIAILIAVKRRQLGFFEAQARYRLTESRQARRITRRRLASTPWPIGARAEPAAETRFFYDRLFSPVLVADLDARVDSLPGQFGLDLFRKAARS